MEPSLPSGVAGQAMGRREEEKDEADAELAALDLEPEPEAAFVDFITDLPAFLLAKVDGDELAHLLESEQNTPFDTPREEEQEEVQDDDDGADGLESPEMEASHKVKKPEGTKLAGFGLQPGEADRDTELNRQALGGLVEDQRHDDRLTQAAHRHRVEAADAHLEGDWQADGPTRQWSISHARILYIVSVYALESPFANEDEREPWLKELHLMVLIYEAIEASLLPFNTVPQWMMAMDSAGRSQKIWLKIAQEGVNFLNDLCKKGYVHMLRVMTEDGWTQNAYRCSKQGEEFLNTVPDKLKSQCDGVVTDRIDGQSKEVIIGTDPDHHGPQIFLRSQSGLKYQSTITDLGKVPYVVSPYLPDCVRHDKALLLKDNSNFSYQCMLWESQVPDDRDEACVLANVSVLLTEWVLTGPNSIGLMVDALEGSVFSERGRKPVVFSTSSADGKLSMTLRKKLTADDEIKTRSTLLDFQPGLDVNFEAEILQSQDLPVKKIQEFGVHINQSGVVQCGAQLEALQDREWDDVAPNLLATVIMDLHFDSSQIVNPMMSKLQIDVLSCLYDGNHMSRTKSLCILAERIEPKLTAAEYMDGGRYQKEFVQLVGEVHTCRDMTDDDVIFIGKEGVLLAGPKSRELEGLIVKYIALMVLDHAIQKLFARIRSLNNKLNRCHQVILERREQVANRLNPRDIINEAGQELRLLWMLMENMRSSIKGAEIVDRPTEHIQQRLWEMLEFAMYKNEIMSRSHDLERLLTCTQNEVRTLTNIADIEDRVDLEEVFYNVDKDAEKLAAPVNATLTHTGEVHMRSEVPLRVITICFGGFLTRDILHRLHIGIETGAPTPAWFSGSTKGFNDAPLLLFLMCLGVFVAGCYFTVWYAGRAMHAAKGFLWRTVILNLPITDLKKFVKFLHNSGCNIAEFNATKMESHESKVVHATFQDSNLLHWMGEYPMLTISYDSENRFIISAKFAWSYWGRHISSSDVKQYVIEMFVNAGAIERPDPDAAPSTGKAQTDGGRKSAVEKRKAAAAQQRAQMQKEMEANAQKAKEKQRGGFFGR